MDEAMIVALQGGLANQLFQWAFGVSVSHARNEKIEFTRFRVDNDPKRSYSLDAFNLDLKFTEKESVNHFYDGGGFNTNVYDAPRDTTFIGYWQSLMYFNPRLINQNDLRLAETPSTVSLQLAERMASSPSAFIHVRRGDYISHPHTNKYHGSLGMGYYTCAIDRIRQQTPDVKFFVFSDDPEWCRQAFPDFTIVDHNKPGDGKQAGLEHEDLWLMAHCKHAILANSSFSLFGAWWGDLQPRIVIAPRTWFQDPSRQDNPALDHWIKL